MIDNLGVNFDVLVSRISIHRFDIGDALAQKFLAVTSPGKQMMFPNLDVGQQFVFR